MDLLGGYGSEDDHLSDDGGTPAPKVADAANVPREGTGNAASDIEAKKPTDASIQLANGSSSDIAASLQSLPVPKARVRRPAKFSLPILIAPDSDSEDDKPKKKAKASSKGISLSDYLPAPVNDSSAASDIPLLGAGVMQGGSRRMGYDSDEEMTGKDPFQDEIVLGPGDEAYNGLDDPNDLPQDNAGEYGSYDTGVTAPYNAYPRDVNGNVRGTVGDSLLSQELQAEAARAMKDGAVQNPLAGVQFKEINQKKLTYMPPEQKQAKNALRTAFGADHEARVREEAGPKPEKRARSKHQITSLFHQAKMKEMEFIEMKGQAVKTRRETQAKYGWS